MTLQEYLKINKIKKKDFAEQLGVNRLTITGYTKKRRRPTRKNMNKILELTGHQVTPNDFYEL